MNRFTLLLALLLAVPAMSAAPAEWNVKGLVVDAKTGEPISGFGVADGVKFRHIWNTQWNPTLGGFRNGRFSQRVLFDKRGTPRIRVEADGYAPQSQVIKKDGQNFTFKLERHAGYDGVVHSPNGKVAPQAHVYLLTGQHNLYLHDGIEIDLRRASSSRDMESMATDSAGRFHFPARWRAEALVILHESGYAELAITNLQRQPKVRLQPWARIEGRVMVGDRPGRRDIVRLVRPAGGWMNYPRHVPYVMCRKQTQCDKDGRFVFEHVPPLDFRVYVNATQDLHFSVQPGETNQIQIGGKGRPVVGRINLEGNDGEFNWRGHRAHIDRLLPDHPSVVTPEKFREIRNRFHLQLAACESEEERIAASRFYADEREAVKIKTARFYQTENGREYGSQRHRITVNFNADGSFRIEDVPGGTYQLKMEFGNRKSGPFGLLDTTFQVPEADGYSAAPFDAGKFVVSMKKPRRLEDLTEAPDFQFTTLDGRGELRLSSFRGKYVLLDFWAMWCGPCLRETPHLKKAWNEFKDDERFAMIGLSLDDTRQPPGIYAKKNKLDWIQGWLGGWSETDVPGRFGIRGIPSIMLIDPKGKILFTKLRGADIADTIRGELQRR